MNQLSSSMKAMPPRWHCVAIFAFLMATQARISFAQPSPGSAKELYTSGRTSYNLGHYEEALRDFEAAYRSKQDAAFLFNIAQCQRNLRRYEDAERSYRAYLRETKNVPPTTREQVQKLIAEMEHSVQEERSKQPPTGTEPPTPYVSPNPVVPTPASGAAGSDSASSQLVKPVPQRPEKTPLYKQPLFWGLVAGAAVVIGVGVGVGVGLGTAPNYPSATMGTVAKQ
jgi:tetratricopeptide repeat protein